MKIGFIGVGNMGGAILKGLRASERFSSDSFYICGNNPEKTRRIGEESGAKVCSDIEEVVSRSDVFFIGVKPNKFDVVLPQVNKGMTHDKLCISMAAGINISKIEEVIGADKKIIRIMPNTPAQVGEIMTSVSRNQQVSDEELQMVIDLFALMGKAEEVDEGLIHAVIGVSGSSPAYTYIYIDSLARAAEKNGIHYDKARVFAAQAVLGAAKMVLETDVALSTLVDNVCSPGGTTIEAVQVLKKEGFDKLVEKGFQAAVDKSIVMSGKK